MMMSSCSFRGNLGPLFASIIALLLNGVFLPIDAATVRVTGTVESEYGQRLSQATVTISIPGYRVSGPHPSVLGRIDFALEVGKATYLRARIESPHYDDKELNVDVIRGVAHLGAIILKSLPSIKLSHLYYFPPRDLDATSGSFDIFVTNETKKALRIDSMSLVGTKRKKTDCGNLPGLHDYVFTVRNEIQVQMDTESDLTIDVQAGAAKDPGIVAASGEIEYLPCDQARVSLTVTYPWTAKPGESKVRITLPLMPTRPTQVSESATHTSTDFRQWDIRVLKMKLDDGREYSSIGK